MRMRSATYSASALESRASKNARFAPADARTLQILSQAPLIVGDDSGGGIQNFLRRAVIFFQAHDARAGIIFIEAKNVADVRAAPAVDRLILVADDAELRDSPTSNRSRSYWTRLVS